MLKKESRHLASHNNRTPARAGGKDVGVVPPLDTSGR